MKLHIYHTNDIHSNYIFLKKVHAYLKENKTNDDLYLDSGDFLDLKDLVVQCDQGVGAIDLLKSSYCDVMAVGNNEFDIGSDALTAVSKKMKMVSCNCAYSDDQKIESIQDYCYIKRFNKRFLIIGASPGYNRLMQDNNFNAFFVMYGLKVYPSIERIQAILKKEKGNYDFSILLIHNGLEVEKNIINVTPEIDLCLGGHSHTKECFKGYNQTGGGDCLGHIVLDIQDDSIQEIVNEHIELEEKEDLEFDEMLKNKREEADIMLSKDIHALEDLHYDAFCESPLMNFVCDALYKHFESDFAIMHNGIAENSLMLPISRKSIIENFPSKLNPTQYTISGEKIFEAIQLSFDDDHIHQDGKGAGFRGHVLGALSFSYNVKILKSPLRVYIDDKELEKDKIYHIVTDDYLQRGTGYPSLKASDDEACWDVWFIRDLVEHYIQNKEIYDLSKIRRIQD